MTDSVLIVTGADDERPSTENLYRIATALAAHECVTVSTFLLRGPAAVRDWPNPRVIDHLRRWWLPWLLERLGAPAVAHRIRGARLRWWLHRARPDVVILDDAVGERVIQHVRRKPVIVHRLNDQASPDHDLERPASGTPDLVLAPPGAEVDAAHSLFTELPFRPAETVQRLLQAAEFVSVGRRQAVREVLGVPADAVVVTGWSRDGWLDGPDLFVRVLWAMERRLGIPAHGMWFSTELPEDLQRLRDEADRCQVGNRFHLFPYDGHGEAPAECLCADVAVLPVREALLRDHLLPAMVSGMPIATFDVAQLADELLTRVPDLDVDALAAAAAEIAKEDRFRRSSDALREFDINGWVSDLLDRCRPQEL